MAGASILSPFQMHAIDKMKNGCILNGGVGSGKSRTALAYYFVQNGGTLTDDGQVEEDMHIPFADGPQDLYIITTALKRDALEWEAEMQLFGMTSYDELKRYNHKVVIDSWNNIVKYNDVQNAFFIFDEQRAVGRGVWVKKGFLKIVKKNYWIMLSATPGDTWRDYAPVFVANGFFKNLSEFDDQHVVFQNFRGYPEIKGYINEWRLIRLRDSILIDLPDQRQTVRHDIDVETNYDKMKYKFYVKERWDDEKQEPIDTAAKLCSMLRKVVNTDTSRQVALLEILEKNDRVIIFYNFNYELDILREICSSCGFTYAEWNGHLHQPIPDTEKWVYLVQYTAGCEGWNCIKTDTIVFYSQNYSYKVMEQATGRIDRVNTLYRDLYFYHLKSKAPIDIAITRAISSKKKFNEGTYLKRSYGISFT